MREKHGMSYTPEHRVWRSMLTRCYNRNCACYSRYGGRGITVCDRWRHSFKNFFEDMGKRPSSSHSIDRIDVNGNYEPSNCRWVTQTVQSNNTRVNKFISINGVERTQAEWSAISGIHPTVIAKRVSLGWTGTKIISAPKRHFSVTLLTHSGRTMTFTEWEKETGISKLTLYSRVKRGWNVDQALTTPARAWRK